MNYYIYYVRGIEAREYLGGTNYVGVWDDSEKMALKQVKSYFKEDTPIACVHKQQVTGHIGYLY